MILMKTRYTPIPIGFLMAILLLALCQTAWSEEGGPVPPLSAQKPPVLTLVRALMCETIRDFEPENETVIFSATLGQAVCFTAFDPVPEKTEIYHLWFKKDQPDAKFKLTLKPSKWASFSQIRLKGSDVGPWRVEITDADGKVFETLRFSVTE
jgi:hypothetical protein